MVSPLCGCTPWMVFIIVPPRRVADDVVADCRQVPVVADHMFVVVALPDRIAGGLAEGVDAFGGN